MKANLITLAIVLVVVGWGIVHLGEVEWTAAKAAGAVMCGVSLPLLVVARLQLGASFSARAKARALVTTGLYARLRNPIYVFGVLFILGLSLLLANWILFLFALVIIPMQMYRARNDERVLAAPFGEVDERYKDATSLSGARSV